MVSAFVVGVGIMVMMLHVEIVADTSQTVPQLEAGECYPRGWIQVYQGHL